MAGRRQLLTLALLLASSAGWAEAPSAAEWARLSPQRQRILAPLAHEWKSLDEVQRLKWLEVAERFPTLTPEEQQRLQSRMRDWARLTPEQRQQARERYEALRHTSPEQRDRVRQRWSEYDALPEPQKRALTHPAPAENRKSGLIKPLEHAPAAKPPAADHNPARPKDGTKSGAQ